MSGPEEGVRRYRHRAMATIFEIMIAGEDESFAGGAAQAAIETIDRLEQDLSRYLPNSDVSRINNLRPGESACVSADTFECLRQSLRYYSETGGAFDVTTGALKDCWVGKDRVPHSPSPDEIEQARSRSGMSRLELDEREMSVRVHGPAPLIDLGGIGKGFAVDCAAELMREWGVASALLHGGTSSVYAFGDHSGHQGWPATISNPVRPSEVLEKIRLKDQALGGSGIRQGNHIIDPRRSAPVERRRSTWVLSQSASRSDALSTACMLMTPGEISDMIARSQDVRALIVDEGPGGILRFGSWAPA